MSAPGQRRRQIAWAAYDWANSAFATTVMAGFFPVWFKQYTAAGLPATESTFWLGLASSLVSIVVMLMSPLVGSHADRAGAHKRWLLGFTAMGVLATSLLPLAGQGQWALALALFALASIGFFGALTPYDSLITGVAAPGELDRVSAMGFAAGYLGGGLLFAVNVLMTVRPDWFGLPDAAAAVKLSFVTVALWWAVFTVPLMLAVPERLPGDDGGVSWQALRQTLRELVAHRSAGLFLLAYWLYIDGVDTIIRMAVDFGLALGLESTSLIKALLMVQFVGFPAALAFGYLAGRIGTRRSIFLALAVYAGVTVAASMLRSEAHFYAMALAIGCVQGGIQALSRSYFAAMVPPGREGAWFGVYNMMGKFAAVLGPVAVGAAAHLSGDSRLSILVILLLFVAGGLLLARVPEPARAPR